VLLTPYLIALPPFSVSLVTGWTMNPSERRRKSSFSTFISVLFALDASQAPNRQRSQQYKHRDGAHHMATVMPSCTFQRFFPLTTQSCQQPFWKKTNVKSRRLPNFPAPDGCPTRSVPPIHAALLVVSGERKHGEKSHDACGNMTDKYRLDKPEIITRKSTTSPPAQHYRLVHETPLPCNQPL
jgi:hypothetical protein